MTLQNQIVSAWHEVLFLKDCRLMRHCGPPPLPTQRPHPLTVRRHPVPRPGGSSSALDALTQMSSALDTH